MLVRRFWLLAVVLIGVVAWGGWQIAGLPLFRLSALRVTGLAHVPRGQIVTLAAIDPHGNVWFLNRHAIERRLETIPYVQTARVSVAPPAVVSIDVTERAIDGCVRNRLHQSFTIDATRHVLEADCATASALEYDLQTPVETSPGDTVRDPELIALMGDRKALEEDGGEYRALSHDALGELQATLRNGVVVKFGDDADLDRKERLVGPILAQLGAQGRAIEAVDVRAADTPVVEYRPRRSPHPHPLDKL
jgi:cell division septal protein FtsQ